MRADPETKGYPAARRARSWRRTIVVLLGVGLICVLLLLPPHGLLDKIDRAAFAVCHRLPHHTFAAAGRPLPLCARCSGAYLGALAGLIVLAARGRIRAGGLPRGRLLAVLALFFVAWGVDALNSLLSLFPGLPHLYEPGNLLRLVSGALQGLVISAFLLPVLNMALWAELDRAPALRSWADLAWMLTAAAVVVALVAVGWDALLQPLVLLSGLAIWGLIGLVNIVPAQILLRQEGGLTALGQAAAPLVVGLALAAAEIAAIASARLVLEARLGL